MPGGGMARIIGMVKNRDADSFAVHGTVIVTPISVFTPGFVVTHTCAVDDMSMADLAFQAHGLGQPHRHGSFLGITESHVAFGSMNGDFKVKEAGLVPIINSQSAVVSANG